MNKQYFTNIFETEGKLDISSILKDKAVAESYDKWLFETAIQFGPVYDKDSSVELVDELFYEMDCEDEQDVQMVAQTIDRPVLRVKLVPAKHQKKYHLKDKSRKGYGYSGSVRGGFGVYGHRPERKPIIDDGKDYGVLLKQAKEKVNEYVQQYLANLRKVVTWNTRLLLEGTGMVGAFNSVLHFQQKTLPRILREDEAELIMSIKDEFPLADSDLTNCVHQFKVAVLSAVDEGVSLYKEELLYSLNYQRMKLKDELADIETQLTNVENQYNAILGYPEN